MTLAVLNLIDLGSNLSERTTVYLKQEIAILLDLHAIRSVICKFDAARIGARREDEIIFQMAVRAVVHDIDTW